MNDRNPKILFVGAFPPEGAQIFGGMVSSCRALMQSSFAKRADLILLDSTQVAHPPPPFLMRLGLAALRFARYVALLEKGRPDAVILFTAAGASVVEKGAMAWYARVRGVAALLFPRGGPVIDACERSRFTRLWTTLAFKGARWILCQGPAWQNFAVGMGFRSSQAPVIPNWTATTALLDIGRARSVRTGAPHLVFVGWLDREKGVAELLNACLHLSARHRFVLTLIGEGNMSDQAAAFVEQHGLSDIIRMTGWLTPEQLLPHYAEADIFVLPSWSEGLPNALVEAMAAGLAPVVTGVGNIPSVVSDRESAMIVKPHDVDGLAQALGELIDDGSLRQNIASRAHKVAESRFGVERAADQILDAVRGARDMER